ncbi:hypothetical protein DFH08DRAFT_826436 [Mycena albidolilacea]|uniref:Uncharacterized protein n=1 Tax=Mycena albidolilacea TaxID=1033008 RepID=A0AAD6Z0V3_9AGAR|nr:hypothetical protein DFH08DRAFT_826436 [Mycena albidolilacea]
MHSHLVPLRLYVRPPTRCTVDPIKNLRAVSIIIPCNQNADDLVGLNVASGTDDHPYFGAIMSYYATENDMLSAMDNYAWMGTTEPTTAVPTIVGNSPQDAQGAE